MLPRDRRAGLMMLLAMGCPQTGHAQRDPVKRGLIHFGYDQSFSGPGPTSGYAFLYYNQPDFGRKDSALRLAVAPVYVDGEYVIGGLLGRRTDLGLGLAGGGWAYGRSEVRQGNFFREESFAGHGGAATISIYHRLNPGRQIPISATLRGSAQFTTYERQSGTDARFEAPAAHTTSVVRTGLRLGGGEPVMDPARGLELSGWYEGRFRDRSGGFGYSGDRPLERASHLLWARALLTHLSPDSGRHIAASLTGGSSLDADRLNAYGLGGALSLTGEFPLNIPGYSTQEITASRFLLLTGRLGVPLGSGRRWMANVFGSSALVNYSPGLEQPGHSHSGVGCGLEFETKSHAWIAALSYGYGVNAIRSAGRGAHSAALTLQYDLLATPEKERPEPGKAQGLRWLRRR